MTADMIWWRLGKRELTDLIGTSKYDPDPVTPEFIDSTKKGHSLGVDTDPFELQRLR